MMHRLRLIVTLTAAAGLGVSQLSPAYAAPATSVHTVGTPAGSPSRSVATVGPTKLSDPDKQLPAGWRSSGDEAVTVVGDEGGLHILAASEASGYSWKTVATLGDPSVDTSSWIGQACVTGSGAAAVVVYAPQQVTNMAGAQGELGRAAVVNLRTGAVIDVAGGYSIAYFDPGCGTGETAVLTEGGWADDSGASPLSTTLAVVNATTGKIASKVKTSGQVTSAVPYQGQIAAVGGKGIEEIGAKGVGRLLTASAGVPFQLTPDASGGIGYQTVVGSNSRLWRFSGGKARSVATVAKGSVSLHQTGGRVWLVGPSASKVSGMPAQWRAVNAPVTGQPSTTGTLVVSSADSAANAETTTTGTGAEPDALKPANISVQILGGSRQKVSFEVPTTAAQALPSASTSSRTAKTTTPQTAGSANTPVSADRTCGVGLNDPTIQAYQPSYQQVEWAADEAVQGALTDARPAGLYGSSIASYEPQGMFPLPSVDGGGSLPAQVLLGLLTQESNLQQASRHVVQGETSNPLNSFNWYGNWTNNDTVDSGLVNWSNSDCGYGIAQITSGMCLAQGQNGNPQCAYQAPLPYQQQLAVAIDYQANIAAGAEALIEKWNQLASLGITPNNHDANQNTSTGESAYIEDWYQALWAYNSGLQPGTALLGNTTGCDPGPDCTDGAGNWGLGYANNPINPAYPPDRPSFGSSSSNVTPTDETYSGSWDLAHPQYWPYQDKVLGFAFNSVALWDYSQSKYVQAFAWAHGNYNQPPLDLFCAAENDCDASGIDYSEPIGPDACQLADPYQDHCWWHTSTAADWTIETPSATCPLCGLQVLTYPAEASQPADPTVEPQYAQSCASSFPSGTAIVDTGGQSALGCITKNWTSEGSFTWNFAGAGDGTYPSKIYFDQIGSGFGGHFWFGYTKPNNLLSVSSPGPADGYENSVITGTWSPPSSISGWTDIMVAIPPYGASAINADYRVDPGAGVPGRNVQVDQAESAGTNSWIDLGDFYLSAGASVSLSNVVSQSNEYVAGLAMGLDIAWDAAAFIPIADPEVNYSALGDSYSAGEGNAPYIDGTDTSTDTCHRSVDSAFPEMVSLPGQATPISENTADVFNFIACSGAETTGISGAAVDNAANSGAYDYNNDVAVQGVGLDENTLNAAGNTDWGTVQYPSNPVPGPVEGMQAANADALNPYTQLVTLTAGGNDSRFVDIVTGCLVAAVGFPVSWLPGYLLGKVDCSGSGWALTRANGATDPYSLASFEPHVINLLKSHLEQMYLDINAAAPNADIVVVGYPQLFTAAPTANCNAAGSVLGTAASLTPSTQLMLNAFGTQLDSVIEEAVSIIKEDGVAIQYVDPQAAFVGHGLCDTGDSWILPVTITNKSGSFHPTPAGQTELAELVDQCLAGTRSC